MQRLRDIQGTNYQDVQFVLNAVNAVIAVSARGFLFVTIDDNVSTI